MAHEVGAASGMADAQCRAFFAKLGTFLGLYRLEAGPPIHRSETCVVYFGRQIETSSISGAYVLRAPGPVALKLMRERAQFEREVSMRGGQALPSDCVVAALGWHCPRAHPSTDQQPEPTDDEPMCAEYPYVLVMERGERSLHDACAKERVAGYNMPAVMSTMRELVRCVAALHAAGICHADLKQRHARW